MIRSEESIQLRISLSSPRTLRVGPWILGSGYLYLLAKYDGKNYGSEVWYVGGLNGIQDLPLFGGGYGLSHIFLFNSNPTQVPDGGTTAFLLGAALTGLAFFRARLQKA